MRTQFTVAVITVSVCLAGLASSVTPVRAERKIPFEKSFQQAQGYFMAGAQSTDLAPMRDRLRAHGYPTFPDGFASLGGGGHVVVRNWVLGLEGHALVTKTRKTTDQLNRLELSAGYFALDLGYQIARAPVSVYPLIGLGVGGYQLRIQDLRRIPFDDILANPGRSTTLNNINLLGEVALGADTMLHMRKKEDRMAGLVLGMRAGYAFATAVGDWHEPGNTHSITGGPDLSLSGPFVRVMIGGGVRRIPQ